MTKKKHNRWLAPLVVATIIGAIIIGGCTMLSAYISRGNTPIPNASPQSPQPGGLDSTNNAQNSNNAQQASTGGQNSPAQICEPGATCYQSVTNAEAQKERDCMGGGSTIKSGESIEWCNDDFVFGVGKINPHEDAVIYLNGRPYLAVAGFESSLFQVNKKTYKLIITKIEDKSVTFVVNRK